MRSDGAPAARSATVASSRKRPACAGERSLGRRPPNSAICAASPRDETSSVAERRAGEEQRVHRDRVEQRARDRQARAGSPLRSPTGRCRVLRRRGRRGTSRSSTATPRPWASTSACQRSCGRAVARDARPATRGRRRARARRARARRCRCRSRSTSSSVRSGCAAAAARSAAVAVDPSARAPAAQSSTSARVTLCRGRRRTACRRAARASRRGCRAGGSGAGGSGRRWMGSRWIGESSMRSRWIGSRWIGSRWMGSRWIGEPVDRRVRERGGVVAQPREGDLRDVDDRHEAGDEGSPCVLVTERPSWVCRSTTMADAEASRRVRGRDRRRRRCGRMRRGSGHRPSATSVQPFASTPAALAPGVRVLPGDRPRRG